jgi:ectoine hydroxylase-related dioxygenase (phytanoyl-CoA dioxygenase family)
VATARTDLDVERHLAEIAEVGYTVVPDVLAPHEASQLLEDLDRLHAELGTSPSRNGFEGTSTLRVYNLLAHGPRWQQVPTHPAVLPVVEGVLDPGCLVSSLSSIAILPGETEQPIHADDQLMPLPKPHPATVCNTMWALTDFTAGNGATRVVPGSHRADASPIIGQPYDTLPAEMPAGSVLVWHGSLWHGGGANTTTERRVGIAMNYCAGWVRQQENQQLGLPLDLVRTFEPRLQELCGFGVYHGLIGHIDRRSPADVVLARPGAEPQHDGLGRV